jgi:hypothetical protein
MNAGDKLVVIATWAVIFGALAAAVHLPLERRAKRRRLARVLRSHRAAIPQHLGPWLRLVEDELGHPLEPWQRHLFVAWLGQPQTRQGWVR